MKLRQRIRHAVAGLQGKNLVTQIVAGTSSELAPLQSYREYQVAYQVHPWVYSCVRVIATNGANAELEAYGRKLFTQPSGQDLEIKEALPDHPATKLMRSPNPAARISRYDLLNLTLGYLELTGNAYWHLNRDDGGVATSITPLRPDRMTPVPNKGMQIVGYIYRVQGVEVPLKEFDIIHLKYFNPYNDYLGQPTLAAARNTLNEDVLAQKYNENFLRNGARPGGAISYDQQLTEADFSRIRAEWKKAHAGADNAHKIAIFERGAKWENMGITQVESDFIEGRKLAREQLSAAFGIPPVLINSYEHANYNTAKTQTQVFWRVTMQPKLVMIAEAVTNQGYKISGRALDAMDSTDWFMDWDTSHVWAIQEEMREGAETSVKMVTNGIMNRNEIRAKQYNLAPIEGGDLYYRPSGQTVITEADAKPTQEDPDDADQPEGDDDKRIIIGYNGKDAMRLDQWKATLVHTETLEGAFAKYYRAVLSDQRELVLSKLREFDLRTGEKRAPGNEFEVEAILFNLEKATEFADESSVPLYERIMAEGGTRGATLARLGFNLDMDNPHAQGVLSKKRQKFAREVSKTTWKSLKESLVLGMKNGEGIVAMASRVGNVMGTRRIDSLQIARTEVLGAYNGGIVEVWNQSETVKGKEWLTAGDEEVRESHEDLDGEKRQLNGTFEVHEGPALSFPGDPAGNANEVINCRCSLTPALEEF